MCKRLTHRHILFLFLGCHCFFLRHTQSKKCIAPSLTVRDNRYGNRYWARMIDNCLNDSAQFRYRNDKHLMLNIKTQGYLMSDYNDKQYRRLSIYYPKISDTIKWVINDRNSLIQNPSGSLYFDSSTEETCIEPGNTDERVHLTRTGCTDVTDEEKKFSFGKEMIIESIKQFFHIEK